MKGRSAVFSPLSGPGLAWNETFEFRWSPTGQLEVVVTSVAGGEAGCSVALEMLRTGCVV